MPKKIFIPIIIVIILILVGVGGWYYFTSQPSDKLGEEEIIDINPEELIVFEVKKENLSEFQKERAFERFTNAKNIINKNKEEGLLNEDNANFYAWLEIAGAQKVIGDYERTAKLWIWFTQVYPGNSISPANLGDLYKSFVVDQEKSEKYYLIALDREKHDLQIFLGLYELYRYRFEDPDKAIQVLKDGRQNNPDNKNYVSELIDYLLLLDRKDEAEEIIDAWLVNHPEDFSLKARLN